MRIAPKTAGKWFSSFFSTRPHNRVVDVVLLARVDVECHAEACESTAEREHLDVVLAWFLRIVLCEAKIALVANAALVEHLAHS